MSGDGFPFDRKRPPVGRILARFALLVIGAVTAAAVGSYAAYDLFQSDRIPDVERLADRRPSIITTVRAFDGQVIGEFAEERRIVVPYDDLPARLLQAIIAVEDADFFNHSGLNLRGILRASIANARAGRVVEGGSSLTQQLAKLMFLTPERSMSRKLNEAILALHIERGYSKEEILGFYANHVYFGHNRYGVEAAAELLFNRHVSELNLAQCALLAGLPQRPNAYSPYRSPDAARERRDHVLRRMHDVGFVSVEELDAALAEEIAPRPFSPGQIEFAPYFVEEVRQHVESTYGEGRLYHDGLSVQTTLDPRLQQTAELAVADGIFALDHRHGWRACATNVLRDTPGVPLEGFVHASWAQSPRLGDLVHGLVMGVTPRVVTVRVGELYGTVTEAPQWTGRKGAASLFSPGDVGYFRVAAVDSEKGRIGLAIEQEPEVEAGLVAMEVGTGRILAMVGGWDFSRSRFNRSVQAMRQPGSAFKPFVYAAAIQRGFTTADLLFDEPIQITDRDTGRVYSPENYSRGYYGLTTLRQAFEQSRNPVSVQILQRVGAQEVIDVARLLGIRSPMEPYPSLALGAFEVTLIELTTAYSVFAAKGMLYEPTFIERIDDRNGQPLSHQRPSGRPVLSPDLAYVMTRLMQGVTQSGTAAQARSLGRNIAGKTGTTDDFTDAWFVGFSPRVVCGVWIGYDVKRSLGRGEVGARAALPIWMEFMKQAIVDPEEGFIAPAGIEFVEIDKSTGLRASSICTRRFTEVFLRGSAPVRECTEHDHEVHALPYYLQKIYMAGGPLPPMASTGATPGPDATPEVEP